MQSSGAAMDDPDVILLVDPHADGPAEQPMVRQGLWPQRIDFEHRGLHRGTGDACPVFQKSLAGSERDEDRNESRADVKVALARLVFHWLPFPL